MSAIPVPVHFDGHNINIITEDSPSTCKNRIKGVKYGKQSKKGRKNNYIQNGKYHKLNKQLPILKPTSSNQSDQASINKQKSPSPHKLSNNGTLIVSPITDTNSENYHDNKSVSTPYRSKVSHDDQKEESPMDKKQAPEQQQQKKPFKSKLNPACKPWVIDDHKQMEETQNNSNQASVDPNFANLYKVNPAVKGRNLEQLMKGNPPRNMPRLPIQAGDNKNAADIELQNKQLLEAGLDPNEFGSHDDIGFDEDEQNGKQDRQNLYKTELCREWSTSGWCYYNKRCSFAHGLQELRPVFRSKKWRTKRCRNWHTTGYCPYEHRCQFLHDQSPPRRISDYATANARALVAAQQRMQPLYFHYQVDCNRDEETPENNEEASTNNGEYAKQCVPCSPKSNKNNGAELENLSVGPRLKRKNYQQRKQDTQQSKYTMVKKNADGTLQNIVSKPPRIARRAHNKPPRKAALPKKNKEPIITPFNPISEYTERHNYDISQTLGMFGQHAVGQVPTLGALPPLPATLSMSGYNPALPSSIDPSLYLSITPSPPQSPDPVLTMNGSLNQKQSLNPEGLNVEVPVSLTPSPTSLALNGPRKKQQPEHMDLLNVKIQQLANGQPSASQQANVTALMQRGGDLNKSQTPVPTIDGFMLQSLLPNDEFIEQQKKKKEEEERVASTVGQNSKPNVSAKPSSSASNAKDAKPQAPIPPIPPPLQLQTSINSVVNGAVAAAMTTTTPAALVPITPNSTLIPQQTNSAANVAPTSFSFANVNASTTNATSTPAQTVDPNQYLLSSQPTAYSQQAHAHAHAYAAAQAHVASTAAFNPGYMNATYPQSAYNGLPSVPLTGVPLQQVPLTGMQYSSFYGASPELPDVSQQTTFYQNHYNPPPRHSRY